MKDRRLERCGGFLHSNVESRIEAGSCIRIILYSFGTLVILPAPDSRCLLHLLQQGKESSR